MNPGILADLMSMKGLGKKTPFKSLVNLQSIPYGASDEDSLNSMQIKFHILLKNAIKDLQGIGNFISAQIENITLHTLCTSMKRDV